MSVDLRDGIGEWRERNRRQLLLLSLRNKETAVGSARVAQVLCDWAAAAASSQLRDYNTGEKHSDTREKKKKNKTHNTHWRVATLGQWRSSVCGGPANRGAARAWTLRAHGAVGGNGVRGRWWAWPRSQQCQSKPDEPPAAKLGERSIQSMRRSRAVGTTRSHNSTRLLGCSLRVHVNAGSTSISANQCSD